jgi:hypothetical protein
VNVVGDEGGEAIGVEGIDRLEDFSDHFARP